MKTDGKVLGGILMVIGSLSAVGLAVFCDEKCIVVCAIVLASLLFIAGLIILICMDRRRRQERKREEKMDRAMRLYWSLPQGTREKVHTITIENERFKIESKKDDTKENILEITITDDKLEIKKTK